MEINDIIKVYLNPFLKEHGFKKYANGWVRELEDGIFSIVIQKGRYNSKNAASWGVRLNALPGSFEEIKKNKYPIEIMAPSKTKIGIRDLLPFEGVFHELLGTFFYFDLHLVPSEDVTVEKLGEKVIALFEEYVIPFSDDINSVADFETAVEKINSGKRPHEKEITHFFLHCLQCAFPRVPNIKGGIRIYKQWEISREMISDNMDVFERLSGHRGQSISKENLYQYLKIFTVLDDRKAFCEEVNRFADMNSGDPDCKLGHITEEDYDSFFESF